MKGKTMADDKGTKAKSKGLTKSALLQEIATSTKLTRKQVGDIFESLTALIKKELGKKGPGVFTIPGLLKLTLVRKPATKARKGPNPFKPGEEVVFKAKPARSLVRPRALKTLNELVK
jgi:nucleoid DNA-binding protein